MDESKPLKLTYDVREEMVSNAEKDAPLETCAVLFGRGNTIDEYYSMKNTDQSEVHFTFEPEQQLEAMKQARKNDKDIIGIYHSHPARDSQAYPSEEDKRHGWEEYIYFILSFTSDGYNLNAFEFENHSVIDHDFEVLKRS